MRRAVLAALMSGFFFSCSTPIACVLPPADDSQDVRGCIATYLPTSNSFTYEPFLKVAAKPTLSEDGRPEVWGFRVWNLEPPDADGLTHPVNVLEENFIPENELKQVGPRTTKCPPYWRGDAGIPPIDHQ
jgi:hypothetical protein